MKKKINLIVSAFIAILILVLIQGAYAENKSGKKGVNKTNLKAGDAYRMQINNVDLPLNREGVIADVQFGGDAGGHFDGKVFLFSSGFFLSGYTNGQLWANGVASASRVQDYVPGTIESGRNDPRAQLYVVSKEDGDFAESWTDWQDAVALGAEFYDGDGDSVYNPVDLNANGIWDPTEDRPDLLGDQTVWCVYNDAVDPALRTWIGNNPQGIEIRQTVFGYASAGLLGNLVFVRYNLLNTGSKAPTLDSVYFGVWADPDLGDHLNDLVGSDTTLNAGFVYDKGSDAEYGPNSPCFLIDFFQGPLAYIPGQTFTDVNANGIFDQGDTPLTNAYNVKGQIRGVDSIPGAKNLGLSSFVHYIQSHPDIGDPDNHIEARYYMLGRNQQGEFLDPCSWTFGTVAGGVNCALVNNKFWYSGDPVANSGWINTNPADERQMSNTGPFTLEAGKPVNIVVAYVVGRGTTSLLSVNEAKRISTFAQFIYDNNFRTPPTPPAVRPVVTTGEDVIDITWNTRRQVTFADSTVAWNIKFEGYNVWAYRTNTTAETVNNVPNVTLLASYDLNNFIHDVYKQNAQTQAVLLQYAQSDSVNQLPYSIYADSATGQIRLRVTADPFTGGPIIKGKPYYFAITGYGLNYDALINRDGAAFGTPGDYMISGAAFAGESENIPQIFTVVVGSDMYSPPASIVPAEQVQGPSSGLVTYDVVDKTKLTGHTYKVDFIIDSASVTYQPFWRLTDETAGEVLIDRSKEYSYGSNDISTPNERQGFIVRVENITPTLGDPQVSGIDTVLKDFDEARGTGVFYIGKDIPQGKPVPAGTALAGLSSIQSSFIRADQLKRVELRFGETGKAYRYLNGYLGSVIQRRSAYTYAAGITAADTVGRGATGRLGEGYVDVPFTAWVVDSVYGETRQLAVGFIEKSVALGGVPDGQWTPSDTIKKTSEYIIIFNENYTAEPANIALTGGNFGTQTVWADLKGYTIPAAAAVDPVQRKIAQSGWFNALYVAGVEVNPGMNIQNGIVSTPVTVYPYTNNDVFTFTTSPGGELSAEEKKALFERVNVFPNPLFAFNPGTSYNNDNPDEPFVTFSNLPQNIDIRIFTLSGSLIRTLRTQDKMGGPASPYLRWNLLNEEGLRVASGMYIAIVNSPEFGEKILKFAIIMPQKQIQRF